MLNNLIKKDGNFNKLLQAINSYEPVTVFGLGTNEQVGVLSDTDQFLLLVTSSFSKAEEYKQLFSDAGKTSEIVFDAHDFLLADTQSRKLSKLTNALAKAGSGLDVLIVSPAVLATKLPQKNGESIKLSKGDNHKLTQLISLLQTFGYERVDTVSAAGEFSVRGDILDVFSPSQQAPVRISFFDTLCEFIKPFDVLSQVTTANEISSFTLVPLLNSLVAPSVKKIILQDLEKQIKIANKEQFEGLNEAKNFFSFTNKNTSWSSVYSDEFSATIFELLPHESHVVFDEPKQVLDVLNEFLKQKHTDIQQRIAVGFALPKHKNFYFTVQEVFNFPTHLGLITFGSITTSNRIFSPKRVFSIKCATLLNYVFNRNLLVSDVVSFSKQNFTQIIYAKDKEFAQMLNQKFLGVGVTSHVVPTLSQVLIGSVNLITLTKNATFGLLEEGLIIIGTNKLFKSHVPEEVNGAEKENTSLPIAFLPTVGDFVVHETHGVGKCVAIEKISLGSSVKDYVVLEYKHGDKLFLPVENLDVVAKYVGGEKEPALNKLGGAEFYATKQKVKGQLKVTALDLVKHYAARESLRGIVFAPDDEFTVAFDDEFAYTETPDQLKAINEVKLDMESDKVMDRLVCGDVGYGKTEVALRAIFKAVNSGFQVAFLCPTTILSQQHYNTCVARMENFGVRVEVLNRFKTPSEQREIIKQTLNGQVQVLIGTHRLLSKDVGFKNLGLLVLDEEQKFGVVDKEKIKVLKQQIDVLTLTATPIPRSLNMALVGIRDISIIETPPPLKLPVISQVLEYRDSLLLGAIMEELKRDGQVLIVFNNITHIFAFAAKVRALLASDVKVSVAHGQMSESQLENEIYNLYNGNTQVLISTTLIENGIDLPTANTLIVVNSDMLGLSQLYQLKGRVGRGNVQAYAYFTYDYTKVLNENALKRLQAISEFTQLGDGYKIAMRDLEIRGAGHVFGVQQSGHILKVGYAMYVELLKQAISEIKGDKIAHIYDVKMESDLVANLPNYFLNSSEKRLKMYSDIAKLTSAAQLKSFVATTRDLYGDVPEGVVNLCFIALIKNKVKLLPVKRVKIKLNEINIEFLDEFKEKLYYRSNDLLSLKENVVLNAGILPIITLSNYLTLYEAVERLDEIINLFETE